MLEFRKVELEDIKEPHYTIYGVTEEDREPVYTNYDLHQVSSGLYGLICTIHMMFNPVVDNLFSFEAADLRQIADKLDELNGVKK